MTIPLSITPQFRVMPDGREICGTHGTYRCKEGVAEYKRRIREMWIRQKSMCCLFGFCPVCPGAIRDGEATFEHEHGRGAGKRDDRIYRDGRWLNGAAHWQCNQWKGSRHIDYNAGRVA